jgi:CRISP-associated protein Cas1
MRELLNTLYVQTQGSMVRLDHDAVQVCREDQAPVRIPLCRLDAITVFGQVTISPAVLQRCAADGRAVVWMSRSGRFVGELRTATSGSVHLRRAQHATLDNPTATLEVARTLVAGKLQNARLLLLRQRRDSEPSKATVFGAAV